MSFAAIPKFWHRLAFRMGLWCGGTLALSSLLCFLIFYGIMVSTMRARTNFDLTYEAKKLVEIAQSGGIDAVNAEIQKEAHAIGVGDIFFRVISRSGTQLASSNLASWAEMNIAGRKPSLSPAGKAVFEDWHASGHHSNVRVLTAPLDDNSLIQIGFSVQDDYRVIQESRRLISLVMIGMVLLAMFLGWVMANRALRGVKAIAATADKISRGALDLRVPVSGHSDEIDALATGFNQMLERIKALVEGMKETNDNIAHELRSPITRIRGLAETTLMGTASVDDYQAMAANTIDGCDRLLGIINAMLDIAEAEAGLAPVSISEVDVAALTRDACELYSPVAKARRVTLNVHGQEACIVRGDLRHIRQALANLVDNAIKYAPEQTAVDATVVQVNSHVRLRITNSGAAIASDDLPHVFDRFYRGKNGRSLPGNGLGLSLAKAIIDAHGGEISVQNQADGKVEFTIILPVDSGPAPVTQKITKT